MTRSNKSYVPDTDDRLKFSNFTKVSNRWINETPREPLDFRLLMLIGRQTKGRQKKWNTIANRYFGERVGWHGLSPSNDVDRKRLIKALRFLEEDMKLVVSEGEPGRMVQWKLDETRDRIFTIQKDGDDKPTNFTQWPNSFEDLMAPNMPRRLNRLLMRVWTETVGRLNSNTYGSTRPWKATFQEVSSELRASSNKTTGEYLNFAVKWGFLTIAISPGKTNTYLPGPHLWRIAQTGDLSPRYRAFFGVTTKPGQPGLVLQRKVA